MFTLLTKKSDKKLDKISKIYLGISAFCIVFAAIYEYFSHEVYSAFMIFAFLIPFLGGTVVFYTIKRFAIKSMPGESLVRLYNCGIATLTVGSIFQGVLEIYGTTNSLVNVYLAVGLMLIISAAAIYTGAVLKKHSTALEGDLEIKEKIITLP